MGTVISGTQVPSSNGSIIKSAATSGSILSVLPFGGGFSMYQLVVRDLTFRAPDNPAINGIDAGWSAQFSAYNLHIETGVYNMLATAPSHVTCGIIAPNSGNGGVTRLQNVDIGGFFVGIKVNEHTWGDYINLTSCKIGLDFILANDTSLFGRIAIQNCPRPIAVDGRHHFDIAQLMIEHLSDAYNSGGTAWMFPLYDIDDAGNNGFGNIRCEIVKGDVGPVDLTRLIKNGGGHIHVQRVGDPPIPAGYHNIIATSVPSSAVSNTPIPWAAGGGDPGLAVDGTDNTRLVCNIAGLYGFDWLGAWTPNATGTVRRNNIVVNATDLIAEDIRPPMAAGFGTTHSFTCSWVLALGDYIQLFGKQDSGGALVLQSTSSSGLLRHRRIAAGWT
jgi:hypothetical protein